VNHLGGGGRRDPLGTRRGIRRRRCGLTGASAAPMCAQDKSPRCAMPVHPVWCKPAKKPHLERPETTTRRIGRQGAMLAQGDGGRTVLGWAGCREGGPDHGRVGLGR
jgi:hypothetical protein